MHHTHRAPLCIHHQALYILPFVLPRSLSFACYRVALAAGVGSALVVLYSRHGKPQLNLQYLAQGPLHDMTCAYLSSLCLLQVCRINLKRVIAYADIRARVSIHTTHYTPVLQDPAAPYLLLSLLLLSFRRPYPLGLAAVRSSACSNCSGRSPTSRD